MISDRMIYIERKTTAKGCVAELSCNSPSRTTRYSRLFVFAGKAPTDRIIFSRMNLGQLPVRIKQQLDLLDLKY